MSYGLGIHFAWTHLPKSENTEHNTTKKKKKKENIKNIQYSVEDHLEKSFQKHPETLEQISFFPSCSKNIQHEIASLFKGLSAQFSLVPMGLMLYSRFLEHTHSAELNSDLDLTTNLKSVDIFQRAAFNIDSTKVEFPLIWVMLNPEMCFFFSLKELPRPLDHVGLITQTLLLPTHLRGSPCMF